MQFLHSLALRTAVSLLTATAAAQTTFQRLDNVLPAGARVLGVSDDGTTLIGIHRPVPNGFEHGFRLRGTSLQDLGVLPNHNVSSAVACNATGDVVVGTSHFQDPQFPLPIEAARAGAQSQFGGLGILQGGTRSAAVGVDASGQVVVGWADAPNQPLVPVMWLVGVIQSLANGTSNDRMRPTAVDDVGTRICGIAEGSSGTRRAVLWSGAGSGPVYLPLLPFDTGSDAIAISSAGDVVVGHSWGPFGNQSVRWRHGAVEELGSPWYGDNHSLWDVLCANADCTLLGGQGLTPGSTVRPVAMLWKEGRGWIDVHGLLLQLGVDLGGSTLASITGISADGSVIVGLTYDLVPYVLRDLPLDGFRVRGIGCGRGAELYHAGLPVRGQGFGIEVVRGNALTWILAGTPVSVQVTACPSCRAGALDIAFMTSSLHVKVPNVPSLVGATMAFQGVGSVGAAPYQCLGTLNFTSAVDVTVR